MGCCRIFPPSLSYGWQCHCTKYSYSTTTNNKTQVFDWLKQGLEKSEVSTKTLRETHSTLGSKFEYRVGDTVHFSTGLRLGIHTILDINSHMYKIGHSGTWLATINSKLMSPTSTPKANNIIKNLRFNGRMIHDHDKWITWSETNKHISYCVHGS